MMRSSALSLALSYVGLGLAALVLFAAPLWYAWQVTIQEGRTEILQADAQRLTEVYRRDGADGLKNFIDARVRMQIAGERILLLTDASMHPLAGNLHAWPASVPAAPGNYTIHVNMGTHGEQTALVHVALLGSNNLLVGRDNLLFKPLQTFFWYGLTAAVAVLCIAGLFVGLITRRALMSRVHSIRRTVSAIIHGDLKHRLPTHLNDDELNTLSRTINGMLEQIELSGARRTQRFELHCPRPADAAGGAALAPRTAVADTPVQRGDLWRDRWRRGGCRPRDPHLRCFAETGGNRCGPASLGLRVVRCVRPCRQCRGILRAGRRTEEHRPQVSNRRPIVDFGRPRASRSGVEQLDR